MGNRLVMVSEEYAPAVRSWLIMMGCAMHESLIAAGVDGEDARRSAVRQHLSRLADSLDGAAESYAWGADSIVTPRLAFAEKFVESGRLFVSDSARLRDEVEYAVRVVFAPPEPQPERG